MRTRTITNKTIVKLRENKMSVIEKCTKEDTPCSRMSGEFCDVYFNPTAAWRRDDCPMADNHLRTRAVEIPKEKTRVGQQKQKKKK